MGPFLEDDSAYVFGGAAPSNPDGAHAGLDVSPAVRDYLGLTGEDLTSWRFVDDAGVPPGPWTNVVRNRGICWGCTN